MAERILIIEDEVKIADFLRRGLAYEGYKVEVAHDGETGLKAARDNVPDLVILDVMLPGLDGLEVARRLRSGGETPILMLTAKDTVSDKVKGFESGADDYLVKPFAFEELLARVKALLRRNKAADQTTFRFSDLTLDTSTREVTRSGRKIDLTTKEFDLLHFFILHPRQVLSRELIYDRIWGYDFGGESNILEVYIRYLRSKLEATSNELAQVLTAEQNQGYKNASVEGGLDAFVNEWAKRIRNNENDDALQKVVTALKGYDQADRHRRKSMLDRALGMVHEFDVTEPRLIQTVRGVGYALREE